jgi:hypothetical protein
VGAAERPLKESVLYQPSGALSTLAFPAPRHRLDGKCPKCPSYAWVLPLAMVFVACLALLGAVYFNRKKLNIAGLSIGVRVCTPRACVIFGCFGH